MHPSTDKRQMLRHTVATLAYRGGKVVCGAPDEFASTRVAEKTRTPAEILTHIGDLLDWALALSRGKHEYHDSTPLARPEEVALFFTAPPTACLRARLGTSVHAGQIGMPRWMAGSPVRGENYFRAEITAGRTGPDQAAAAFEFE